MPKIIDIHPSKPHPESIKAAAEIIKSGGIVFFPTQFLYGLGADALNIEAVKKVFAIKQRSLSKPISILIKNRDEIDKLVRYIPPAALRIMDSFWPGKITIVFEAKDLIPDHLTAGTGKIGIRLPEHPVAAALLNSLKNPITGTSANISDNTGCSCVPDLVPQIAEKLDLILDAGPLKGGAGSTVIDVTPPEPRIIRKGAVSPKDIFAIL
ncbi:L-threonylcarbamoyladenylate synthase [Thermodesulfobacteriota bacterium]